MPNLHIAFYIQPIEPVQVASRLLRKQIRLRQCTTWLLNLPRNMCAMEDIQVNSFVGFDKQFKFMANFLL